MIEVIILFFIELEVAWDWYHEIRKKRSPNYGSSNLLRAVVLIGVMLVAPFIRTLTIDQWWSIVPMALLNFWFLFDWHLNVARTLSGHPRPYWYLGDNSKLDKWQRANGGSFKWFWIKMSMAMVSVLVFEIGFFDILHFISISFK